MLLNNLQRMVREPRRWRYDGGRAGRALFVYVRGSERSSTVAAPLSPHAAEDQNERVPDLDNDHRSDLPNPFVHNDDATPDVVSPEPGAPVVVDESPAPARNPRCAGPPVELAELLPQQGSPLHLNFLRLICDAQDRIPEDSRVGGDDHVHVSTLVDLCPRHYVLARRRGDPVVRTFTGGHKVTFAIGRAVQDYVRQSVVRALDREHMYGDWSCSCGAQVFRGRWVGGIQCRRCNTDIDNYVEPTLVDDEHGIVGSPDLTFFDGNHMIPVEIKSISLRRWDELDGPLANDLLQVLLYRWLYLRNEHRVRREVVIFYVAKDFRWGSPYKEYHIDAESHRCNTMLHEALRIALTIKAAEGGPVPPRTLCDSPGCSRALNCPLSVPCFNLPGG